MFPSTTGEVPLIFFRNLFFGSICGGGQEGGSPGERRVGGVGEAGEEGAGSGILKVAGETEKLPNIAQYFAIEKAQRGGQPANKRELKQPLRQRRGKRHFKNDFQIFQTFFALVSTRSICLM